MDSSTTAASNCPVHPVPTNQQDSSLPEEHFLKAGLTIRLRNCDGSHARSEQQQFKRSFPLLHCQVARLRKEDQQLVEDVTEVLDTPKERMILHHLTAHVGDISVTTPRASTPSPLGIRTRSWSADEWDSPTLSRTSSSSF